MGGGEDDFKEVSWSKELEHKDALKVAAFAIVDTYKNSDALLEDATDKILDMMLDLMRDIHSDVVECMIEVPLERVRSRGPPLDLERGSSLED